MATAVCDLFAVLPLELRLEVYNYLSAPETTTTASIVGLPLKHKKFECKHTTVQICPVHYGSTNLLALQVYRFKEAREYGSWLLNNAIELRIGVTFKGRVNTFVQQDWDNKMAAHLRKLAKQHPWLKKVVKYSIHFLWSPIDGVLRSKKNQRTAGRIVRDMAATLTTLLPGNVKQKRGELSMKLCLDHQNAVETAISATRFGFADFLLPTGSKLDGFKKQTREVWKEAHTQQADQNIVPKFVPIPTFPSRAQSVMDVRASSVEWTVGIDGTLVMRKELVDGKPTSMVGSDCKQHPTSDHVAYSLLSECLVGA
ncbi:hypothetical protein BDU57DRAFT_455680 [Ampelomyces quisqualis]|uniref:Uncharacterized protein n=1 Tax=Ampelomyces quisqualis TaxID=50730 RepID=A0A6A5QET6_AMPQU|nr:hypothetical protein BDU57DRAFT_455680 [Ampelomyces quisqualis]